MKPGSLGSRKGLSLLEVLVSMALLLVLALGTSTFFTRSKEITVQMGDQATCQSVVTGLVTNIKSFDNDTFIRNWLPTEGLTIIRAPSSALDPFCNDNRMLCDSMDQIVFGPNSVTYQNFQNRRNATAWAMTLYNYAREFSAYRSRLGSTRSVSLNNCSVYIHDFDPMLFPNEINPESLAQKGIIGVDVLLEQRLQDSASGDCNSVRISPRVKGVISVTVVARYKDATHDEDTDPDRAPACAARTMVGFGVDPVAPVATVIARNPFGPVPLSTDANNPTNLCDPRYPRDRAREGRQLTFELTASEPGSVFACQAFTSTSGQPGPMRSCTDVAFGSLGSQFVWMNPTETFNVRPIAELRFGEIPHQPDSPRVVYSFAAEVADVGLNVSRVPSGSNQYFHFTAEPACPDPTEYCAGASRPDGCGANCPPGRRRQQGCPDPRLVCPGHEACDDCEQNACPGTRGVNVVEGAKNPANFNTPGTPDCPPRDTYTWCEVRYTWCGQQCPRGTKRPLEPDRSRYCSGDRVHNSCGEFIGNGTATAAENPDCADGISNNPPSVCPSNTATYCQNDVIKDWDGRNCRAGTMPSDCPAQTDYCPGRGQVIFDSCGNQCLPGQARFEYCCGGCNSAGNPPSFKRERSCQEHISEQGGTGSCVLIDNCYQYVP